MKTITSAALLVLSWVMVAGCRTQPHSPANVLGAVLIPNHSAGTIGVQCLISSSGRCYFALFGMVAGNNTTLSVATGDRKVVNGVDENTLYCAESQQAFLAHCTQLLLPREQAFIQMGIHSDGPMHLAR